MISFSRRRASRNSSSEGLDDFWFNIAISARVTKQPPERLGWVFTNKDYHHAAGMRPDLVALQRNVALVKELGLTDKDTDVAKYSDLSLLDEAAKRLK